jgi:Tat protein secretion system quality control protein TatD with DNase activity
MKYKKIYMSYERRLCFGKLKSKHVLFFQIRLACDLKKPLFLHERDAHVEMVELLSRYRDRLPNCVIHCFTGSKEQAVKYLEMGCYIGLTGNAESFRLELNR